MKEYSKPFEENNSTLLDCFGGADGGISYAVFVNGMRDFAKQAEEGDESAKAICDIVSKFSKLVRVMNSK